MARLEDMPDIIQEEFGAKISGWLVLLDKQKKLGKTVVTKPSRSDLADITYKDGVRPVWIIKILPESASKLLA